MSNPTPDLVLNAASGHVISANAPITGTMSGGDTSQLATQAYVDANGPSGAFPHATGSIQLGTPSAPIAPSASYTYDIDLGGQYVEIALSDFGWVERNSVTQNDPGITLSRAVFSGDPEGGVLIVNTNHLGVGNGLSWYRGFRMSHNEFQDGSSTPIVQLFFASANDVVNPLGYGSTSLQTPLDNLELETSPVGKLEISDMWLSAPGVGNTHLFVKVTNCGATTLTLAAYVGASNVYGYQFPNTSNMDQTVSVTNEGHMAVMSTSLQDLAISEDAGLTWINAGIRTPSISAFGLASYVNGGVGHIAAIGRNLTSGNVDVATCSSTGEYVMSKVNSWVLPAAAAEFNISSRDLSLNEIGGNQLGFNSSVGAFLYVSDAVKADSFLNQYSSNDILLFKSVDGFVNIGANSPSFTDLNPIFTASVAIPNWVSSGCLAPMYVKAIDGNNMFISLGYNAHNPGTVSNVSITAPTASQIIWPYNNMPFNTIVAGNIVPYDFWFFEAATFAADTFQKLTYTALAAGSAGNGISVQYYENGVAGSEVVQVQGDSILVTIGHHNVLSSTSNQVKAAINASTAAMNLISPVTGGDDVADQISTAGGQSLHGGQDDWTYQGALPPGQNFPITILPSDNATAVATAMVTAFANLPNTVVTQANATNVTVTSNIGAELPMYDSTRTPGVSVTFSVFASLGSYATNYALLKTSNGGSSWTQVLTQPEFMYAADRCVHVSDNGLTILAVVVGTSGYQSYPYGNQEYRFNMSTDGGSTWTYSTGNWPLMSNEAPKVYSPSLDPQGAFNGAVQPFDSCSSLLIAKISGTIIFMGRKSSIDNGYEDNGLPAIMRSSDNGATWSSFNELSSWTTAGSLDLSILQNEATDSFLGFIEVNPNNDQKGGSLGNAGDQSYLYRGTNLTTFTNWTCYAR